MNRKDLSKYIFSVIISLMEFGPMRRLIVFMTFAIALACGTAAMAKGGDAKTQGRKVIEIKDVLVVEGKVQKPRVMYILDKAKIKYRGIPLREDFLKRVELPLQEDRF